MGLPLFPTMKEAVKYLKPNATAIFVAASRAAGAIKEAIEAEISLVVAVAEHVPVHDIMEVCGPGGIRLVPGVIFDLCIRSTAS